MSKRKKEPDYLEGLEEWNEHMYTPGYYTGGRIPHFRRHPPKPHLNAIAMFINGALSIFFILWIVFSTFIEVNYNGTCGFTFSYIREERSFSNIFGCMTMILFALSLCILFFLAGRRYLRMHREKGRPIKKKRIRFNLRKY